MLIEISKFLKALQITVKPLSCYFSWHHTLTLAFVVICCMFHYQDAIKLYAQQPVNIFFV